MRLNKPSQIRKDYEQVKMSKIVGFHPAKNHPMVQPLDHFQGKNRNCSYLARTIAILKMGWLSKFISLRSIPFWLGGACAAPHQDGPLLRTMDDFLLDEILQFCSFLLVRNPSSVTALTQTKLVWLFAMFKIIQPPNQAKPVRNSNCQAQSSSSFSFTEQTELALFPIYPATHPSTHPHWDISQQQITL